MQYSIVLFLTKVCHFCICVFCAQYAISSV